MICNSGNPGCIQCCEKNCYRAFHVSCAFNAGWDLQELVQVADDGNCFVGRCSQHSQRNTAVIPVNQDSKNPAAKPPKAGKLTRYTSESKYRKWCQDSVQGREATTVAHVISSESKARKLQPFNDVPVSAEANFALANNVSDLYCLCRQPHLGDDFMIACEKVCHMTQRA